MENKKNKLCGNGFVPCPAPSGPCCGSSDPTKTYVCDQERGCVQCAESNVMNCDNICCPVGQCFDGNTQCCLNSGDQYCGGKCQLAANCCGTEVCTSDETCCNGLCMDNPGVCCADLWYPNDTLCCSGKGCDTLCAYDGSCCTTPCNNNTLCCASGQSCSNNMCCPTGQQSPDGKICCLPGQTVADGECCWTCGSGCCTGNTDTCHWYYPEYGHPFQEC